LKRSAEAVDAIDTLIGRRFRSTGSSFTTWEVVSIDALPGEEIPHARLCRVGSRSDLKTLSSRVLSDRSLYEPV